MSQETNKRVVLAGFLIIIGVVLVLRNFHIFPYIPWLFTWPMILVLIGVFILLTRQSVMVALIFVGVGLWFLLPDMFNLYIDRFWDLWPIILIAIGISLILRHRSPRYVAHGTARTGESAMDYLDEVAIFGGGEKIITSNKFKGGKITNIFGGSEINFLQAKLAPEPVYIDVFTLFGGSTLIVPSDWNVKVDMVSIFGGFGDKRDVRKEDLGKNEPEVYIKGLMLFGGGELKSRK
jgi:predicted membrane protein